MVRKPRGLRLSDECMQLIDRMARVTGVAGYEVVERAVQEEYKRFRTSNDFGRALMELEASDKRKEQ